MKVLVAYFSQTGNTEKVARAICEEASKGNDAELKELKEVAPDDVTDFDIIFVGSPLHSASLPVPIKEFLSNTSAGSGQKLAAFITHFASAYPEQSMDEFTAPISSACSEKGIEYKGTFDCQGALTEALHKTVQKKLNLNDEEWAGMVSAMTGHPNEEDLGNARAFAKEVLG